MQSLKVSIMVKTDVNRVCDYTLYYFCRVCLMFLIKAHSFLILFKHNYDRMSINDDCSIGNV